MGDSLYRTFMTASYDYYHGAGSDMPDAVWDQLSHKYAPIISAYHDIEYTGGSLFWLSKDQYPDFIYSEK
jgi:NAD-dependent DNA ligase